MEFKIYPMNTMKNIFLILCTLILAICCHFCSNNIYGKLSIIWDGKLFVLWQHDAAENAAIMYSLLGCCKACDVNPENGLQMY
jgi:hypothetical protein